MSMIRGVRGATTVTTNSAEAIISATKELLQAMIDANEIKEADVASVFFTTTPDLDAAFPAQAARAVGWWEVALLGAQEINCPVGLPMCIRVLMHWNTPKALSDIRHVYMHGAERLRPDMYPTNKIVLDGADEQANR